MPESARSAKAEDRYTNQLAERDAEIARLRSRLVEVNTELGNALGKLAVLEARSQRLTGLLRGLWLRIPLLKHLPSILLRRLKSRRA